MPESPEGGTRIAVLVSGQGRNLQALIDATQAGQISGRIVGVISDRSDAFALERARQAQIPDITVDRHDYAHRATFDDALTDSLSTLNPDLVVLAGFMRILGESFIARFSDGLINIHPSLLPLYPGLNTHQRALDTGDREHGATVHLVNNELDGGLRIIQGTVSVVRQDDAQTLAERLMMNVETKILPQTVAWFANGRLRLDDGMAYFDGRALDHPLSQSDLDPEFS